MRLMSVLLFCAFSSVGKREARIRLEKAASSSSSEANVSSVIKKPSQINIKSLAEIKSEKEKRNKVTESGEPVSAVVADAMKPVPRKRRNIEIYRPRAAAASNDNDGNSKMPLILVDIVL